MIDVAPAEEIFEIDVMDDIHARNPPTLFIKMSDVFAMHHLVASHVSGMCLSHEDNNLREVIRDLGNPKNNEAEMAAGSSEVTLSLSGKLHNIEGVLPTASLSVISVLTFNRPGCGHQSSLHGDEAMRAVHHSDTSGRQSHGYHGEANKSK